jgi:hypothetical protein
VTKTALSAENVAQGERMTPWATKSDGSRLIEAVRSLALS